MTSRKASRKRTSTARRRRGRRRRAGAGRVWVGVAAVGVGLAALAVWSSSPRGGATDGDAPAFTLASTDGGTVSLSDYRGRNVLLYFNEGVGCDACFTQTVELERNADALEEEDIELVPIVVNPVPEVRSTLEAFGIRTPYLIDEGARVSAAYGVLGTGMHPGVPGHSFVLVDAAGRIRWSMSYPSMFVSTSDLLAALRPSLS